MPVRANELRSLLQNKFGFLKSQTHADHDWYEIEIPGIPVIATKVSHGRKEIRRNLESKICRQLRVRKLFFREMVGCTKDKDEYCRQVQEDPYPPFDVLF